MASPTKLQTGFQSLTKDFLRFWMVDIHREGRSQKSAPQKRHKAHPISAQKLRLGWGGEKSRCTRREYAHQAPGSLSCSDGEGTKRRPSGVWASVEYPKAWTWVAYAWEVHENQGLLPVEQPGAWAVWTGEAHTREWGQTQCGWNTASAPHTRQWPVFAVPLPHQSRTEQVNLNKRPPPPTCVSAEIRHCRDLQTEVK